MIRCSVTVMAHPARAAFVGELVAELDRPATVVWDRFGDRHDTGARALDAGDRTATHHLVVQDDAIVCADLVAGVERALSFVPDGHPLGLYIGRVRPFAGEVTKLVERASDDTSFVTMPDLNWGVAVAVPAGHLDALVAAVGATGANVPVNYDRRMSNWYAERKVATWYTWPSLVDHRDSPTLVRGHGDRRHAHRFLGTDRSALDVDWSGGIVEMQVERATAGRR